jgi:hypothetical protein
MLEDDFSFETFFFGAMSLFLGPMGG